MVDNSAIRLNPQTAVIVQAIATFGKAVFTPTWEGEFIEETLKTATPTYELNKNPEFKKEGIAHIPDGGTLPQYLKIR